MKTTVRKIGMTAAALGLLLGAVESRAANGSWNGTTGGDAGPNNAGQQWSDTTKWVSGTVAGTVGTADSPDTLTMNNQGHYTITLDNDYNISNAYHNVGSHRHAIVQTNGVSTLRLSKGGSVLATGNGNVRYCTPIRLEGGSGGSYSFLHGGTLDIFGPVSGTATTGGNFDLILGGGGGSLFTLLTTYVGSLSDGVGGGTLSVIKTGTGVWFLRNNSAYTGTTTVRNGRLKFENVNSFGTGSSAIQLGDSGTGPGETVDLEIASNITFSRNININNFNPSGQSILSVRNNLGTPVFSGQITLNRDVTIHTENSGFPTFSGKITGTGGIIKTGPDRATLSSTLNDYQGATTVNAGILVASAAGSLASSPITVNGGVLRANQGVGLGTANSLSLNGGVWEATSANITRTLGSGAGQVQLSGYSGFSANGANINVNLNGGAGLAWGSTAGFNASTLVLNETTAANQITLQNALDLNGANRTVAVNANTAVISGAIGNGSGTAGLTKSGAGTLNLTGLNTFNGGLTLNGGTLNVRNTNTLVSAITANAGALTVDYTGQNTGASLLPASAPLTMGGGTFTVSGSGVAAQTTAQTVNGLTLAAGASTVAATASGGRPVVLNLGGITRASSSATVNFTLPSGTQDAANGILTSSGSASTRLGMWATVNGSEWAAKDAENDNIVPWSSVGGTYTDVTRLSSGSKAIASNPASDVRIVDGTGTAANITNAAPGTTDIATLFAGVTGGTATYDPGASDVLRLSATGTVALTGATGSGALTIGTVANDGILTAGGAANTAGTLVFVNNHPSNLILVNSSIADNGTGAVGVESAGLGTVAFAPNASYTYTGTTTVHSGAVQINHNSGDTAVSVRSLAGPTLLNGGTLRFQHTGAGHYNPVLTFTSPILVSSNGGAIAFGGAANDFNNNTLGPLTLSGDLTVSGITGNSGVSYRFVNGAVTLNTDARITNATGPNNAHTIRLSPTITGATRTLTLDRSGSGTGFEVYAATATSLDLARLATTNGAALAFYITATGVNPLAQIKANGGTLTMGPASTLIFQGTVTASGPLFDPTAVVWQGNNTLTIERDSGGNRDTYLRIVNTNLVVSAASGLTTLNAMPWRAYYTVDAPYALIIGAGGTMNYTVGSNVRETFRGNLTLLDGATIVGINSGGNPGGIIRDTTGGGALILGNGSASVITVQGNHGTDTDSFNLGFSTNMTDNGEAKMRYANTGASAGNLFNIGWSNGGGDFSAAFVAFKETSGGTQFAPLAGSGGVAVVGAASGTVATFAKAATVSTAGTVGFYNEINTNQRGNLGPLEIAATGSLAFQTNGTVQAGNVTFKAGAALGVRLTGASPTACSLVDASGTLTFESGTAITITEEPGLPTTYKGPWYVAKGATLSGLPKKTVGLYTVTAEANQVRIDRLASGTVLLLR